MGIIVSIYRDDYTSPFCAFRDVKRLTIINVEGPFEPTPDRPAAILRDGALGSKHIVPADRTMYAHGGAFADTSDSRFRKATGFYGAVALHDYDLNAEAARVPATIPEGA